jgi:hypothetical protein
MSDDYRYIDIDQINEDIESGKAEVVKDDPNDVLFGTILDLLQLAENEGMSEAEVDDVMRRIIDHRAEQCRARFRVHPPE